MRKRRLPDPASKSSRLDPSVFFFSIAFFLGVIGGYFCCRASGAGSEIKEYLNRYAQVLVAGGTVTTASLLWRRGVVLSRAVRCVFVWRFPTCILFDLRCFFAGGFSSLLCSGKLYSGLGQKRRSDLPVCFWHPHSADLSHFHRHCVAAHAVGRGADRAAHRKAKGIVRQPRSTLLYFQFGHTGFGRFGRAYICSKARFACTAAAFINDSQKRR